LYYTFKFYFKLVNFLHHDNVGVAGQSATRGITNVAHLCKMLHNVAESLGARVDQNVAAQQFGVVQRQRVVQTDVAFDVRFAVAELDYGYFGRNTLLDAVESII
jgi:hypothetical protein